MLLLNSQLSHKQTAVWSATSSHLLIAVECCRRLGHGLSHLVSSAPDWIAHVLLVTNVVLLLLLHVVVLGRAATVSTQSLVKTSVGQVSPLPWTVVWHKAGILWLLWELLCGSESHNVWHKSTVLSHNVAEWLILVQDQTVKSGVLLSVDVLFTLVWVLLIVTQTVLWSEGLSSLTVIETAWSINECS